MTLNRLAKPCAPRLLALALVCAPSLLALSAWAQPASELVNLSLEELARIQITSVSRKAESLANAPASIFVISADDIRRSGAVTLPEALRLAPNLQVARINARSYAITARGFNALSANKLLVMVDGRTLYAPLFSGVFWDVQDVVLADVERIEVVSGPGATLWGANAVNGVINVITRSASATQGTMVGAGASGIERNGLIRHGGVLPSGGHYRVYGKYGGHDDTELRGGGSAQDGWHREQAGFRADWSDALDAFSVHGDAYSGRLNQFGTRDVEASGANLVGLWKRQLPDGSSMHWQAYFDHAERDQPNRVNERVDTIDLEFQNTRDLAQAHRMVWGAGYRLAWSQTEKRGTEIAFLPERLTMHWANLFAQDEWTLNDAWRLTAGLKLEHSTYTEVEAMPSLRLAWNPSDAHMWWAAVSRALRAPSRIDRDLYSPSSAVAMIEGGPDVRSEVATVTELGYRGQVSRDLSYSVTAFQTRYDRLRTLEPNPSPPRFVFRNLGEANVSGVEMWGNWQARRDWRLAAGLVMQDIDQDFDRGSADISAAAGLAANDPDHYWMLRASHDMSADKRLDLTLRHVGRLSNPAVPAYSALDLHYSWQIRRDLELTLLGRNLLDRRHVEYVTGPAASELERSVFLRLLWRM